MKRKKREESAFSWPVIGIDLPYPEHVREALRLVAEETQRRKQAECGHENRDWRFAHRGLDRGLHADAGRETYCVDCKRVLGFEVADPPQQRGGYRIPIVLDPAITLEDDGAPATALRNFTGQIVAELRDEVRQLQPRQRGRLRESNE